MPCVPAFLEEIPQFIMYRKEPKGAVKLNKVPCSYLTGAAASALDPANWTAAMLAESWAAVHGDTYGVGFVLTSDVKIAAIDIDQCRNADTGQLSEIAHTLMALLPGAYVEVSVSGTGLHLWVTYSGAMPPHGSRNAAYGLEFYSADRFIALGEPLPAARGDGRADHAAVLPGLIAQYFPAGATVTGETAWTTEPREDWRGPTDDEELIQRMLRVQTAEQAFGGRASVADLWRADAAALSRNYPDAGGRPYDASSADAALAQHLAFWTGCDCERIRRLMEQSALARDKWERSDYLTRTILGAVSRQEDVYQPKAKVTTPSTPSGESSNRDAMYQTMMQRGSQDSIALIFADTNKGKIVYDNAWGRWREYDGTRWRLDDTQKVFNMIGNLCRRENTEGKASIGSSGFVKGVEVMASANPVLSVRGDEWDADNYILNMPDCTLDLRTNQRRPHNPDDKLTLSTSVSPSLEGGAEFLKFMEAITCGDLELANYLQVSLGSCLSGAVETQGLDFWVGEGGNGKSTLAELVKSAMGGYARKIRSSVLMAKRNEAHPTEIANLQGARLALSSEVSPNDFWDEARICEVTGDDELSARRMRCDDFSFRRTHRHIILGNYKPQIRTTSEGVRRRIKIVPFNASFVGREDRGLKARLEAGMGYVLHWMLEGHLKWLEAGRRVPVCRIVDEASREYFESQSTPQLWIEQRVEILETDDRPVSHLPTSSSLYADYKRWKKERGELELSQTRWADCMKRFEREKGANVRYRGLQLRPQLIEASTFSVAPISHFAVQ